MFSPLLTFLIFNVSGIQQSDSVMHRYVYIPINIYIDIQIYLLFSFSVMSSLVSGPRLYGHKLKEFCGTQSQWLQFECSRVWAQ